MKLVVYVEGPGDKACLETLLRPLIAAKMSHGARIDFVPMTRGDRKRQLVKMAPRKAANAIRNDPEISVVILPDLYPPNKGFPHETCGEMQAGVRMEFESAIADERADKRMMSRFHVFCMIHDLEVLLLAAREALSADRGLEQPTWPDEVEEQNHDDPPKRVVSRLFEQTGETYEPTIDGPRVLEAAGHYELIRDRCPQGFGRFVRFLEAI